MLGWLKQGIKKYLYKETDIKAFRKLALLQSQILNNTEENSLA